MTAADFLDGQILLIDKPLGWTSFDVVNKIRWHLKKVFGLKKIKVGHAGTLDPLATGLLILCTGKFTKQIDSLQAQQKTYTGTIFLGATTPSYDLETAVDQTFAIDHITETTLKNAAKTFEGVIAQKPPVFSAIKKDGQRLYDLARAGKEVHIEARKVAIYECSITRIDMPEVDFKVVCSKGTYIRSLAHDFGKALQSGAYLKTLRRTQIGDYSIADAISVDDFISAVQ